MPPLIEEIYDYRCWEPLFTHTLLPGSNPLAIQNVTEASRDVLKFKFSTKNNKAIETPPAYRKAHGRVHRNNQAYTLEFFANAGSVTKFIVFESISIKDITNYNKAVIQTKYGEVRLDASDLKAVFRYFKTISTGLASRNSTITSGTMEASGGSRLNYRSNSSMYKTAKHANYNQLTEVDFYEG